MGFKLKHALGAIAPGIGLPLLFKDGLGGNNYQPSGPNMRKPNEASDVKLLDPLKAPLGGYVKTGQNSLADSLGTISSNAARGSAVSGRAPGVYQGQALGRANTLASRGIEDTVGGVLGDTSLEEMKAQRDFDANMALAQEIGALNKPSTLQEVLGGLGGAAKTGGQFAGLYGALKGNRTAGGGPGYSNNPFYGTGANPFDPEQALSRIRGY